VPRSPNQKAPTNYTFALSFLFFSFLFSKPEQLIITMAITILIIFTFAHHLECATLSHDHLEKQG
jgi:hypothetical protein